MSLIAFTAYDGINVAGSADAILSTPYAMGGGDLPLRPVLRGRVGRYPELDAAEFGETSIPIQIRQSPGSVLTSDQFDGYVHALFRQRKGLVAMGATMEGDTVQNAGIVHGVRRAVSTKLYTATLLMPNPVWRSTTTNTDSSSPLTNAGRVRALPVITITPTTSSVRRRRVTVADVAGRGLANFPILAAYDASVGGAAAASDHIAFFRAQPMAQRVNSPGAAGTKHWFCIDVPPNQSRYADVFYGSSVDNTALADSLEYGGINFEGAVVSNTVLEWNDWRNSLFPARAGTWKPVKFGIMPSGVSFGIASEGASSGKTGYSNTITLGIGGPNAYRGEANALLLTLGAEAGATNAIQNLYAYLTVSTGAGYVKATLYYRVPGSSVWQVKETRNTTGALATTQDIDGAIQVLIALEALIPNVVADVAIGWSGGGSYPQITMANTPTVTVGNAATARRLNGTLTNTTTGDVITFDDVYLDDEALTINCLTKQVSTASGLWYSGGRGIRFSNKEDLFPLVPGSNAWTVAIDGTVSIAWESSYLAT